MITDVALALASAEADLLGLSLQDCEPMWWLCDTCYSARVATVPYYGYKARKQSRKQNEPATIREARVG